MKMLILGLAHSRCSINGGDRGPDSVPGSLQVNGRSSNRLLVTHFPPRTGNVSRPTSAHGKPIPSDRLLATFTLLTQHPRCGQLQVLRMSRAQSCKCKTVAGEGPPRRHSPAPTCPAPTCQEAVKKPHLPVCLLFCASLIIVRVGKIKGFRGGCQGPCCCLPALHVTDARQSRLPRPLAPASRATLGLAGQHTAVYEGLSPAVPTDPAEQKGSLL